MGIAPIASGEAHNTCGLPDVLECAAAGCTQRLQDEANCGECGNLCSGLCVEGVCHTPELPSGCTPLEHAGRSYLSCKESITWDAARVACQDRGKDLASVETEAEADYLAGQLTEVPFAWLGVCQWGDDAVVLRDDGLFASAYEENLLPYLCEDPAD